MTSKFLYGKKRFLTPFIKGVISPRFTDISHYARLENKNMRDNEMHKTFIVNRLAVQIKINNHILNPESLAEDPTISIPTRHCYCLCLTDKKNDAELYKVFQADVCIEINIDILIEVLYQIFYFNFKEMEVEARQISYFDPYDPPIIGKPRDLVFYKPRVFSHEAEFRIALFYPLYKRGFLGENKVVIPFMLKDESIWLTFHHPVKPIFKQCVIKIYEKI